MNMTMMNPAKPTLVPPLVVPPFKKRLLYDTFDPMININPNTLIPKILNKNRGNGIMGMTLSSLDDY